MTTVYKFRAAYTKLGVGTAPSSAPLATVVDSANNILANAVATTALTNLPGVYLYSYSGTDGLDVIALFHTSDATVDQQDLYSYTPDSVAHVTLVDTTITNTDMLTAAAVLAAAAGNPISSNIKEVNDTAIQGTGTVGTDEWRKV